LMYLNLFMTSSCSLTPTPSPSTSTNVSFHATTRNMIKCVLSCNNKKHGLTAITWPWQPFWTQTTINYKNNNMTNTVVV
jgi:hypothetical protein